MPKRRHKDDEEYLDRKIRKLVNKLRKRNDRRSRSRSSYRSRSRSYSHSDRDSPAPDERHAAVNDILGSPPLNPQVIPLESSSEINHVVDEEVVPPNLNNTLSDKENTEAVADDSAVITENTDAGGELNKELLDILGADPTATTEYGADIHAEVASRLQHVATTGLTKEARKELNDKYLIPANCVLIGAPTMNPEIKAALTEVVIKRDKGIETRQKQLASAISGIANIITNELSSSDKNSTKLKQLMDISRILCDIQHAESTTRRNFATYSIKKELKDHLTNTKIDKTLFGENLSETLKSAKAVSKSGSELKTKPPPKPKSVVTPGTYNNNLNWKSPAPARKPLQPPQQHNRGRGGREAAPPPAPGPAARYSRSAPHASSSRTSQHHNKQRRR